MQTRTGLCYPKPVYGDNGRRKRSREDTNTTRRKKQRPAPPPAISVDFFDGLPDDLVTIVLCQLSSSASSPSDFANILMTCKRFNGLALNPMVLSKASKKSLTVRAQNWCEQAHRFLKRCAEAGNLEACYILGMIKFYCLQNRGGGAALMAKAAIGSHAAALYSLAIIQFNGSGGCKTDKDLRAGVALCARSAFLGHIDALRELGHCLQDGYGVRQNVTEGRRFLIQANARELATVLPSAAAATWQPHKHAVGSSCPLLSDFGCNVPVQVVHPANRFLTEWFEVNRVGVEDDDGLRLCSNTGCGRPETRKHEFRRCSVCGTVNYCSRACQAMHWKFVHKMECTPLARWLNEAVEMEEVEPVVGVN